MASISSSNKGCIRNRSSLSARKDKLLGLASLSGSYGSSSMEGNCSSDQLEEEDLWAEAEDQARAMQYERSSNKWRGSRAGRGQHPSSDLHHQEYSAPVNIPDWSHILGAEERAYRGFQNLGISQDEDDDDERVPPHELVAREHAKSQTPTFSVYEGVGRTLKGRDLDRVRSAVLRETGFIDHL